MGYGQRAHASWHRSIYHPQRSTSGSGVLGTSAIFNAAMKSKDICSMEGKLWQTYAAAAADAAKSLQSCPTLCDPIDGSPPSSAIPGIPQARILEQVAISFSNTWKWKVKVKSFSRVWLLTTPWTAAYQAPPSMGFSRQEYWSIIPKFFLSVLTWKLSYWLFHFNFIKSRGNLKHLAFLNVF